MRLCSTGAADQFTDVFEAYASSLVWGTADQEAYVFGLHARVFVSERLPAGYQLVLPLFSDSAWVETGPGRDYGAVLSLTCGGTAHSTYGGPQP